MEVALEKNIYNVFTQNIDCGYKLETSRRAISNEYPHFVFLIKNI